MDTKIDSISREIMGKALSQAREGRIHILDEMAKAITALTLNKNYVQDEALRWGFLTREEQSHLDRRKERPEQ